jgi:hypothetical protein
MRRSIYNAVSIVAGIVPMLVIVLLRNCKSHSGATGHENGPGSPPLCLV